MTGHIIGGARKRIAEDTTSRDEQGAATHAAILGRHEWIGGSDPEPVLTLFCSKCQGGTKPYVCGPCKGTPSWWCLRCGSPQWSGDPSEGCPDCGFVSEVQP